MGSRVVRLWHGQDLLGASQTLSDGDIAVLAVTHDTQLNREKVSSVTRNRAQEVLGTWLQLPLDAVQLHRIAGQPLQMEHSVGTVGLSLSHAHGLSLVAMNGLGRVGIDVVNLDREALPHSETHALIQDYLGPQRAVEIQLQMDAQPPEQQSRIFAMAWAAWEARLKCMGLGLTEWSASLEAHLAPCQAQSLSMLAPYVGAVAIALNSHASRGSHAGFGI